MSEVTDETLEQTATPAPVEEEGLWETLTAPLEGYVKILTNKGKVKLLLKAPDQERVKERCEELTKPAPPKVEIKLEGSKGKKATREIDDENDPAYLKALDEWNMLQTFILLDESLIKLPAGDTFEKRVQIYKRMSAPVLTVVIAGIQSLMMQEYPADMLDDMELGEE